MRQPIVDGQFYESEPDKLKKQIQDCFKHKLGPKALPSGQRDDKLTGAIAPHAGYPFSGPCQAHAYKRIAEAKIPDLYIIFGVSHSGFSSCISIDGWQTPLGTVRTDKEFGKQLSKYLPIDEVAHQNEHSIEVQLPFLQYINIDKDFKILPVLISPDIDIGELAKSIKDILKQTKKTAVLIASSDFTHFGPNYNYTPFSNNIKENLYRLDKEAIEHIKKLNTRAFLGYIQERGATICGMYPIMALIETAKLLGAKKAELLKYYTSGDILGDYTNSVGYGAVIIK